MVQRLGDIFDPGSSFAGNERGVIGLRETHKDAADFQNGERFTE